MQTNGAVFGSQFSDIFAIVTDESRPEVGKLRPAGCTRPATGSCDNMHTRKFDKGVGRAQGKRRIAPRTSPTPKCLDKQRKVITVIVSDYCIAIMDFDSEKLLEILFSPLEIINIAAFLCAARLV